MFNVFFYYLDLDPYRPVGFEVFFQSWMQMQQWAWVA